MGRSAAEQNQFDAETEASPIRVERKHYEPSGQIKRPRGVAPRGPGGSRQSTGRLAAMFGGSGRWSRTALPNAIRLESPDGSHLLAIAPTSPI